MYCLSLRSILGIFFNGFSNVFPRKFYLFISIFICINQSHVFFNFYTFFTMWIFLYKSKILSCAFKRILLRFFPILTFQIIQHLTWKCIVFMTDSYCDAYLTSVRCSIANWGNFLRVENKLLLIILFLYNIFVEKFKKQFCFIGKVKIKFSNILFNKTYFI